MLKATHPLDLGTDSRGILPESACPRPGQGRRGWRRGSPILRCHGDPRRFPRKIWRSPSYGWLISMGKYPIVRNGGWLGVARHDETETTKLRFRLENHRSRCGNHWEAGQIRKHDLLCSSLFIVCNVHQRFGGHLRSSCDHQLEVTCRHNGIDLGTHVSM